MQLEPNFSFKDLIENEQLLFLVGAGCSIDAPSCLPSGWSMMEAIIRYICAESEVESPVPPGVICPVGTLRSGSMPIRAVPADAGG